MAAAVEAVEPQPFVDGIVYGEGPRWHNGRLWFTDGPAGKVYSAGESGDLAVDVKIHLVDVQGNVTSTFDLSDIAWSTNDLLVTPSGRAYVDLYRAAGDGIGLVGDDGSVKVVATGVSLPNGLGLLPDASTLVVSETRGSRILAIPVQTDGSLGTPGVFADLGPDRHPDGLCVDVEGAVWVGCVDTSEFIRVLAGGTVTHRATIDQGCAIAPALGGPDGRTLYIVLDDTTIEGVAKGESTGWVMQARVDVPGAGSP